VSFDWEAPVRWLDESEPRLEDALSDPVVRAMMERDGVVADDIRDLASRVRRRWQPAPNRRRGGWVERGRGELEAAAPAP